MSEQSTKTTKEVKDSDEFEIEDIDINDYLRVDYSFLISVVLMFLGLVLMMFSDGITLTQKGTSLLVSGSIIYGFTFLTHGINKIYTSNSTDAVEV